MSADASDRFWAFAPVAKLSLDALDAYFLSMHKVLRLFGVKCQTTLINDPEAGEYQASDYRATIDGSLMLIGQYREHTRTFTLRLLHAGPLTRLPVVISYNNNLAVAVITKDDADVFRVYTSNGAGPVELTYADVDLWPMFIASLRDYYQLMVPEGKRPFSDDDFPSAWFGPEGPVRAYALDRFDEANDVTDAVQFLVRRGRIDVSAGVAYFPGWISPNSYSHNSHQQPVRVTQPIRELSQLDPRIVFGICSEHAAFVDALDSYIALMPHLVTDVLERDTKDLADVKPLQIDKVLDEVFYLTLFLKGRTLTNYMIEHRLHDGSGTASHRGLGARWSFKVTRVSDHFAALLQSAMLLWRLRRTTGLEELVARYTLTYPIQVAPTVEHLRRYCLQCPENVDMRPSSAPVIYTPRATAIAASLVVSESIDSGTAVRASPASSMDSSEPAHNDDQT